MRIRKRKVPLPLSLLSPVPLTDLHLFSRSPVQQPTSSSDHFPASSSFSNAFASDPRHLTTTTTSNVSLPSTGVDEGVQMSNNDDASNATITPSSAPAYHNNNPTTTTPNNTSNHRPLPFPLSNNEGRSWCDGDGVIPLKKRRTTMMKCDHEKGRRLNEKKEDDNNKRMKSSTVTPDQSRSIVNDDNGSNSNDQEGGVAAAVSAKKSNSKRGNTIMEGSRCSRVNGRGWRCCQPTLVGYSLCEHHLGKGRLRSMTSTAKAKKNASNSAVGGGSGSGKFAIGDHEERETVESSNEKVKMERMSLFGNGNSSSKRVKLGVVKARSLSSLLGQTNTMNINGNIVGDQHHADVQYQQE